MKEEGDKKKKIEEEKMKEEEEKMKKMKEGEEKKIIEDILKILLVELFVENLVRDKQERIDLEVNLKKFKIK